MEGRPEEQVLQQKGTYGAMARYDIRSQGKNETRSERIG
jgi:hypothetical protein